MSPTCSWRSDKARPPAPATFAMLFTSPPEQNAFPAPVITSTRTPSSCSAARAALRTSPSMSTEIGLRCSGRLNVIVAICSSTS